MVMSDSRASSPIWPRSRAFRLQAYRYAFFIFQTNNSVVFDKIQINKFVNCYKIQRKNVFEGILSSPLLAGFGQNHIVLGCLCPAYTVYDCAVDYEAAMNEHFS